jgi:hypothetical protein
VSVIEEVMVFIDGSESMAETDIGGFLNMLEKYESKKLKNSVPNPSEWKYYIGDGEISGVNDGNIGNSSFFRGHTCFSSILNIQSELRNKSSLAVLFFDGVTNGYFYQDYSINWLLELVRGPFVFIMPEVGLNRQGLEYFRLLNELDLRLFSMDGYYLATNIYKVKSGKDR